MKQLLNNRYVQEKELGSGGMGVVHLAQDRLTGSPVALKQVKIPTKQLQFMSRTPTMATDRLRLSLAREFQMLATLRHPHIISVLDYGFDRERQPFYTMTYLPQAQNIIDAGAQLSFVEKTDFIQQMLQALAYLHRRGVFHRDLKPDNVLVTDGHLRVLDFGLAVERTEDAAHSSGGTLAYWAPELWLGQPFTEATDLFALGIIAFELLTGQHPFGPVDSFLMDRVLDEEPDFDLLGENLPITAVLQKLLAKDPITRYQSAKDILHDLEQGIGGVDGQETAVIRESYLQAATFVGRDTEMSQLRKALTQAEMGESAIWLIGGESGVGKSRLLDEFRIYALVADWQVMTGQAIAEGSPYQLWRDIIPQLVLNIELSDLEASVLKSIAPMLPTLLDHAIPDPPELPRAAAQQRLILTISDLLRRQPHPTLLLLEDLQWAESSLDPLVTLLRMVSTNQLLIIGSYRDDEHPKLPKYLPGAQVLPLSRLDESSVTELTQAMLGDQIASQQEIVSLLQQETEGNAFFLVEVVRALAEEAGQLADIMTMTLPNRVLTGGIQQLIQRRLDRVPANDYPLLQLAAIAGRELDLALIEQMSSSIQLARWLETCQEAAVLNVQNNRWRFAHDKLREGILADLSTAIRPELHRHVAQTIEQIYPDDPMQAGILTQHWRIVGDLQKERFFAQPAGEYAASQFANEDAIQYFSRALDLTPKQNYEDRYRLLQAREQVYDLLGQRIAQKRDLSVLTELVNELNVLENQAIVANRRADYQYYTGNYKVTIFEAKEAVTLAQKAGSINQEAIGKRHWGAALWRQGEYKDAQPLLEDSLANSRRIGDWQGQGCTLDHLGLVAYYMGAYDEAQQNYEESLTFSRKIGDRRWEAITLGNLGMVAFELSRYHEARQYDKASLVIRHKIGDRTGEGLILNNLGLVEMALCEYNKARQNYETSLTFSREAGDRRGEANVLQNLGNLARELGDYDRAHQQYESSLIIRREIGDRRGEGFTLHNKGISYHKQRQFQQAKDNYQQALHLRHELGHKAHIGYTLIRMGHLAYDMGDLSKSLAYYQEAKALLHASSHRPDLIEARIGLAAVAQAQGRVKESQEQMASIWPTLAEHDLSGDWDGMRTCLISFNLFHNWQDARADIVLAKAYKILQIRATKIEDETFRCSYLENVAEHCALIKLHQQYFPNT